MNTKQRKSILEEFKGCLLRGQSDVWYTVGTRSIHPPNTPMHRVPTVFFFACLDTVGTNVVHGGCTDRVPTVYLTAL